MSAIILGRWRKTLAAGALVALGSLLLTQASVGQQIHRNGFEGREPVWIKGPADGPFREEVHEV